MGENPPMNPKKNKFGTSVSFDLEESPAPKRREKKQSEQNLEVAVEDIKPSFAEVECPGCGHGPSEDEWLEALVGFVSGVRDFELGNPVRARIVQTLRNSVSNMDTPHPRDVWEVSIVNRLMEEIKRIVQAEVLRISNDEMEQKFSITEVQEMIEATERETRMSMVNDVWGEAVVQVQAALEPELRKQIESELWVEFEAELRRRQAS